LARGIGIFAAPRNCRFLAALRMTIWLKCHNILQVSISEPKLWPTRLAVANTSRGNTPPSFGCAHRCDTISSVRRRDHTPGSHVLRDDDLARRQNTNAGLFLYPERRRCVSHRKSALAAIASSCSHTPGCIPADLPLQEQHSHARERSSARPNRPSGAIGKDETRCHLPPTSLPA
jgi:hypothetical protein